MTPLVCALYRKKTRKQNIHGIVSGFLGGFVYVFFFLIRNDPKTHINKFLPPTQTRDNPGNVFMFMCFLQGKEEYTPPPWNLSFLGLSPDPKVAEQKSYCVYPFPGKTREKGIHHRSGKKGIHHRASDPEKEKKGGLHGGGVYSEAWGPPQFQEKRSRSEKAILGALGEFRGILGAALGIIGNSILGIRNSILGMASHDLLNTKPTILGATLGAIPAIAATPPEIFSFAPAFSERFFKNWGGPRAPDILFLPCFPWNERTGQRISEGTGGPSNCRTCGMPSLASVALVALLVGARRDLLRGAQHMSNGTLLPKLMPISFFRRVSRFSGFSGKGISGNAGNFLSRFTRVYLVFEVFQTKWRTSVFALFAINAIAHVSWDGFYREGLYGGSHMGA